MHLSDPVGLPGTGIPDHVPVGIEILVDQGEGSQLELEVKAARGDQPSFVVVGDLRTKGVIVGGAVQVVHHLAPGHLPRWFQLGDDGPLSRDLHRCPEIVGKSGEFPGSVYIPGFIMDPVVKPETASHAARGNLLPLQS